MSGRLRGRRWPVAVALGLTAATAAAGPAAASPGTTTGVTATRGVATAVGGLMNTVATTVAKGPKWRADDGENSLFTIEASNGAHRVWTTKDASGRTVTGKGVGVALVDSGIAPVDGLSGAGKVVNGPDLSFESQSAALRYTDTFGHGTHMAGIIAGRGSTVVAGRESDPTKFVGMAPDATIVNMKVAAADGAVDVSQVIAAINWTVQHRNDPGLNVRVLSLSYGTDSLQDPRLDPLSHAVEAAWRAGIVVVAAVGNDGASSTRVTMPAANPYVIAVGGIDTRGTPAKVDDTIGDFSTRGSTTRHADLVAAGRSVVSLRDPGSYIDTNYPGGLVPSDKTQTLFRGSGTSQATAVVAGAVALLLQQRPTLTPDQVKRLLTSTATPLLGADPISMGAGQLDIAAAVAAPTPQYAQTWPRSLGTGSLEASRGTSHVADPMTGVELTGEVDIMGQAWKPTTWSTATTAGTAWTGGTWNARTWSGSTWTGTSWSARTWSGATWTSSTWTGVAWSARTWSDATWTGRTWSGRTWSGRTWSGRTWSGRTWG